MAEHSAMLHVRVDQDTKDKAAATLSAMGLSVSDAVRLLLHRIVADQAFPLELKVPSAETRAAMIEADAMVGTRSARFTTAEALIATLEKNAGQ